MEQMIYHWPCFISRRRSKNKPTLTSFLFNSSFLILFGLWFSRIDERLYSEMWQFMSHTSPSLTSAKASESCTWFFLQLFTSVPVRTIPASNVSVNSYSWPAFLLSLIMLLLHNRGEWIFRLKCGRCCCRSKKDFAIEKIAAKINMKARFIFSVCQLQKNDCNCCLHRKIFKLQRNPEDLGTRTYIRTVYII